MIGPFWLIDATLHLHALQFDHGDISPDNIIVDADRINFIDLLDIFPGGGRKPYNPAYAPTDYDNLPLAERDCFAVAKVCRDILVASAPAPRDSSGIQSEIEACIMREPGVYRLDRILDAIQKFLSTPQVARPTITVQTKAVKEVCEMVGDNGVYHVGVFEDKNRPGIGRLTIGGVRKQLILSIDLESLSVVWVGVRDLQHSKFVFSAQKAIHMLKCSLRLVPGLDKLSEFVDMLLAIPAVWEALEGLAGADVTLRPEATAIGTGEAPPTESIWKALIAAEETTLSASKANGFNGTFGRGGGDRTTPISKSRDLMALPPPAKFKC